MGSRSKIRCRRRVVDRVAKHTIRRGPSDRVPFEPDFVVVFINNKKCCILKELKLTATFTGGNSIGFVSSDLENQIENQIANNSNYVFQKIEECLN